MRPYTLIRAVTYTLLLVLVACVSLESPKTFNEKLAYGYAGVAAAADTASAMVERGRLTKAQGKQALALVDQSTTALDLARAAFKKGDITLANSQLQLALSVLTALESYLKETQ